VEAAMADAAAASGQSAALAGQQQQGLRLSSFTTNLPSAADVLAALPQHSLTYLNLNLQHSNSVLIGGLSALLPCSICSLATTLLTPCAGCQAAFWQACRSSAS
jgi:hypothetical protein